MSFLLALAGFLSIDPVCPAPLPAPDTGAVRPISVGTVQGCVIDAATHRTLPGAWIRIEQDGAFAKDGPTVARTDDAGRYQAKAHIGRSWSKIDWVRVFTSFPPLLLLRPQSVQKQSRTILATRLNVRVERDGYRPFVGEVQCERLDAGKYTVSLDDVWLAPASSSLASFSPDHVRHERIESFTVEPAVAQPGDAVTVTARMEIPFERGGRYRVYFDSSEPQLINTELAMERVGSPDPKTGLTTFRRVVRLPRKPRVWTTELSPWVSLDYREIPLEGDFRSLLQVVHEDAERAAARKVAEGYDHLVKGDAGAAVEALRGAAAGDAKYAPAYRYLGEAYQESGRTEEAADAYERLVALAPQDLEVALPRYAEALLDSGRTEAAARALDAAEKQSKRVPVPVALARARLFARRGDLRAADEQLARAGQRGRIPRKLQREIALRRAEAALRAAPDSPDAELALSRALADLDRLEEAETHARRAQSLRPDEPWPLIELAALEHRLDHPETATAALERALVLDPQNGDAHFALGQLLLAGGQYALAGEHFRRAAERRPYDFAARHGLALAELREALQSTEAGGQSPVARVPTKWVDQTPDAGRQTPVKMPEGERTESAGPTPNQQKLASGPPTSWVPGRLASAGPALEELREAAVMGRGKGEMNPGLEAPFGLITTLYFSPKRVTVEGFSRRAAADDYQLAQALERLKRRPDDALAHLNAGTALARLGQADLALASLDRAAALDPGLSDISYWRAVALIGLHRPDEARQALEEALRQNPLHPRAHLALARLCLDAGEMEQAEAHLAAHRRNWPNGVEPEPEDGE